MTKWKLFSSFFSLFAAWLPVMEETSSNYLFLQSRTSRSYSDAHIRHLPTAPSPSQLTPSIDLFSLIMPAQKDPLPSLICSICSLPMSKPTTLPCQHTFCFQCLQNHQQVRFGSLPLYSSSHSLCSDTQTKLITCQQCSRIHQVNSLSELQENQSMEFLINTLLCEKCHQLHPSNQLDTCFHCFEVLCPHCYEEHLLQHQKESNTESKAIESPGKGKVPSTEQSPPEKENLDPTQTNVSKKKSNSLLRRIINPSRHRHTNSLPGKESTPKSPLSPTKHTDSVRNLFRSKANFPIKLDENPPTKTDPQQPSTPVTPVRRFFNLHDQYTHTAEHIKQCRQRQLELDYTVKKLIEVLTMKTTENLEQISTYWVYVKKNLLAPYQLKSNHQQIIDYFMTKTCCSLLHSQKQIELHLDRNDEINACLRMLTSTLLIMHTPQNALTINQLFDREEQTVIRTLKRQLESLSSMYAEEISFIIERIHSYDTRFASWKNSNPTDLDSVAYEWTHIIEHDYPAIIQRISDDFINKMPQLEATLILMLKSMKTRLGNINTQPASRRTSES